MAATATKLKFSQSTNGRGIKVAATTTAGTAIHTAVPGVIAGTFDEVWLWAYNSDSVDRLLTLEWGGVSAPDDNIAVTVPSQSGLMLIAPGLILQNGLSIAAFAAATNVIIIYGFVNRVVS